MSLTWPQRSRMVSAPAAWRSGWCRWPLVPSASPCRRIASASMSPPTAPLAPRAAVGARRGPRRARCRPLCRPGPRRGRVPARARGAVSRWQHRVGNRAAVQCGAGLRHRGPAEPPIPGLACGGARRIRACRRADCRPRTCRTRGQLQPRAGVRHQQRPSQTIAVINTAAALAHRPALVGDIPAGLFPRDISYDPATGQVLVANYHSGAGAKPSAPAVNGRSEGSSRCRLASLCHNRAEAAVCGSPSAASAFPSAGYFGAVDRADRPAGDCD